MRHSGHFLICAAMAGELCIGIAAVNAQQLDSLEDIGVDGSAFESRMIDGVSVLLATARGAAICATYCDSSPLMFSGTPDCTSQNYPAQPANVSGTRFIGGPDGGFIHAQPFEFVFSEPVAAFGLTTLDLLEQGDPNGDRAYVSLVAFDVEGNVVAEHRRSGAQGLSGLDLDWLVEVGQPVIVRATLGGEVDQAWDGHGLDDLYVRRAANCSADFNRDGDVNTLDVLAFLNAWTSGDSSADFNRDGTVNTLDVLAFLNAWAAGC